MVNKRYTNLIANVQMLVLMPISPSLFSIFVAASVTGNKSPNVYKKFPKNDFTRIMIDFDTFTKNCPRMWEIWSN